MSWLIRILVGLGIVLALVIAFVLVIGNWGASGPPTQAVSMTVGNRTITVAGHYKDMRQESLADGIKVVVDGQEVVISGDQLTLNGETEILEPEHDVMIYVGKDGKVQVKIVHEDDGAADDEGAPEEAPE
jgi:hypothetical protein